MLPDICAINLGVAGYTSYQGYQVLAKQALQLNPDCLIISFNYNDRRYVLDSDHIDSSTNFKKLYAQQKLRLEWLRHLYWCRSLKDLFEKLGIIPHVKNVGIDKLWPRVSLEDYRENLVKMVELAKRKKILCFYSFGITPFKQNI